MECYNLLVLHDCVLLQQWILHFVGLYFCMLYNFLWLINLI